MLANDAEAGVAVTVTPGALPVPVKTILGVTTTVPALGGAPSWYLKRYDADADALLPYVVTSPYTEAGALVKVTVWQQAVRKGGNVAMICAYVLASPEEDAT